MRNSILISIFVLFVVAWAARAAFHLWTISEIYSSADGSVQFVEFSPQSGQTSMSGQTLRSTNALGMTTFTFPSNLTVGASGSLLMGTSNLLTIPGGVVPDYVIPPNFIRAPVGGNAAVIFSGSGSTMVYTNLPVDGDSALLRSGNIGIVVPTNSPRNINSKSNMIVPVKFLAATRGTNSIGVVFRTATGVNGSTGPNYALQANDTFGTANWNTISNVTGNGTPKTVSLSTTGAARVFRLKSP